jgi:hypothetical protein
VKTRLRLLFAPLALGLVVWQLSGCKHTPSPPTVEDAIAVWKNVNSKPHMQDLISLRKTNGQMSQMNGVATYTIFYSAEIKSLVQLGNEPPGTVRTYESNYPFQWTEKGWMGPDGKVYPEH